MSAAGRSKKTLLTTTSSFLTTPLSSQRPLLTAPMNNAGSAACQVLGPSLGGRAYNGRGLRPVFLNARILAVVKGQNS